MTGELAFKTLKIVGAGLIGTSIALRAAEKGLKVSVSDRDLNAEHLARDLIAGAYADLKPELVVIATPPDAVIEVLKSEYQLNPEAIFIDVSSVKFKVEDDVNRLTGIRPQFIGTHPMAGRENSGADSAQSDLFVGRAWFVTSHPKVDLKNLERVKGFIEMMGASVYEIDATAHDRLMAHISHLPQLTSTALAASLQSQSDGLELAGQGLRDMTRLAGSDARLWSQILIANSEQLLPVIAEFIGILQQLTEGLAEKDASLIERVFLEGSKNRARIGGKHGAVPRNYAHLLIVIKDEPGALSDLFLECAKLDANIEDLSIEHSPGQLTGLITLAFSPDDAQKVKSHLIDKDWVVHQR